MNDLPSLLRTLNVPHRLPGEHRHASKLIAVDCPWCSVPGAGLYHLGLSPGGWAVCWRCGSHRTGDALARLAGIPVAEALRRLESVSGGPEYPRIASERSGRVKLPSGLRPLYGPFSRYISSRGFLADKIGKLWGVKATGTAGRLAWRLWLPIVLRGEVVSWTTRTIGRSEPRYVNAPATSEAVDARTLLYGEDLVIGRSVVVVEGPIDAWALGPGAVATMGVGWTRAQLLRIARYPTRHVCFDADPAGRRRAEKLVRELAAFPGATSIIRLETGKDAAEASEVELSEIRGLLT